MPFASALSVAPSTSRAIAEACSSIRQSLPGTIDLVLAFFSRDHLSQTHELAEQLQEHLQPRCLLGCVGETIIGGGREVESGAALSLWAGSWARPVQLEPFHLLLERTSEGASLLGWPDALVAEGRQDLAVLLLGDPFTFPIDVFLRQSNEEAPGVPVLGGMASGITAAGECRFLYGKETRDQGAIGVVLQGAVGLRSIVSQGCRPIGRPLVITRSNDNLILELGGRRAVDQLRDLWQSLSAEDQALMQQGLHIGRVITEYRDLFQRGDFLVRNVMALDRDSGGLYISDPVRVGQTIQFHVRDAQTADEDLHAMLQLDVSAHEKQAAAALLFSCNGRGTRLFPNPDHDAQVLQAEVGAIPLAGFFAQGELGPVGGQNFIHGFTASVALFEE